VLWSDALHLFAGYSDIKGIRSTDGGVTWTLGYTGHDANTMYRLVKHPSTNALYAATSYPLYVLIDRDGNIAGQQDGGLAPDPARRPNHQGHLIL